MVAYIQRNGSQLIVHNDNGTSEVIYPSSGHIWRGRGGGDTGGSPGTPPGGGSGGGGGWKVVEEPLTSFEGLHWNGAPYTYNATQCRRAWEIIRQASDIQGITRDMVAAALMCSMVETVLYIYANASVPASLDEEYDFVGNAVDALGLYQQRPSVGWGTVPALMDTAYSTRAFIGGPNGPNNGMPPGLLDISPAWDTYANLGDAVEAVQISGIGARYQVVHQTALDMFDAMTEPLGGAGGVINPFPGKYDSSDPFGNYGGRSQPHTGSDWNGIPEGTPVPALTAGTVVSKEWTSVVGNTICVKMRDYPLYYAYLHLNSPASSAIGRVVETGTPIGSLGTTGSSSTGPHLHVTISDSELAYIGIGNKVDPYQWIIDHGGEP